MNQIPLGPDSDVDTRAAYQRHVDAYKAWEVTKILLDQAELNFEAQFNKCADTAATNTVLCNAQSVEQRAWATLQAVAGTIHQFKPGQ